MPIRLEGTKWVDAEFIVVDCLQIELNEQRLYFENEHIQLIIPEEGKSINGTEPTT